MLLQVNIKDLMILFPQTTSLREKTYIEDIKIEKLSMKMNFFSFKIFNLTFFDLLKVLKGLFRVLDFFRIVTFFTFKGLYGSLSRKTGRLGSLRNP